MTKSMKAYYSDKTMYEDEQKKYTKLQDIINDTATQYDLGTIGYVEARQVISNAIKTYYPEIFAKYGEESEKIQEIIDQKMEEAGIQKEASKDINDTVDESNKQLVESYTKLSEDLGKVFEILNNMLSTYATNTNSMVSNVIATIQKVKSALSELNTSINDNVIDTSINVETNLKETIKSKTNQSTSNTTSKKAKTAGKSHSGMELGYIGDGSISGDKKAFKYIALNELKNDEIVRVLQKGEGVATEGQINMIMSNFRKVAEFKVPTLSFNNQQPSQSIEFNGDIVIQNPVGNSSNLAAEIRQNLGQAVLQELYKK